MNEALLKEIQNLCIPWIHHHSTKKDITLFIRCEPSHNRLVYFLSKQTDPMLDTVEKALDFVLDILSNDQDDRYKNAMEEYNKEEKVHNTLLFSSSS